MGASVELNHRIAIAELFHTGYKGSDIYQRPLLCYWEKYQRRPKEDSQLYK